MTESILAHYIREYGSPSLDALKQISQMYLVMPKVQENDPKKYHDIIVRVYV